MEQKVINTESGKKDGLNRCPYCGATDVALNSMSGKLRCGFFFSFFESTVINAVDDISRLVGEVIGSGAANIVPDEKVILTFQCSACGSSIVVDTNEAVSARCHWCRHNLSVNEQVPNGAVPDMVLPFRMEKVTAEGKIREFVGKRQFFACPAFKKEFSTNNVMGVYLPYMVVDVNGRAKLTGQAERLIRAYTSNKVRYYDADLYNVEREFDLLIDDLTIESSSKRLNQNLLVNTNNVINAIMPFDVENCVAWDANYLKGFASEKRDVDVDGLRQKLALQVKDVARFKANETITFYDRGAKWGAEDVDVKGTKWKAAYLPVWLYSYLEVKKNGKLLHYCAVNARTGTVMGSIPIDKGRLLIASAIVEAIGIVVGGAWFLAWIQVPIDDNPALWGLAGLTPGFIFYWWTKNRYRNMSARHYHEKNTRATMHNVRTADALVTRRKALRNSRIEGANNDAVHGVVARGGEKMMGEKMAVALGIGKMVGAQGMPQDKAAVKKSGKSAGMVIGLILAALVLLAIFFG
jgi:DNA-directed RNA polymerase subunit RPC12/RpoP